MVLIKTSSINVQFPSQMKFSQPVSARRTRVIGRVLSSLTLLAAALFVQAAMGEATSSNRTLLPGTRFATECYIKDSGMPGPTIMIVGGVHGNEPAGANAAEVIRQWPINRGKLVVIPRANIPGLAANKRLIPQLSTNLNNLNRNYPRAGKDEGPRGDLASSIWAVALEVKPDWLLDLHEGFDFHQVNDKSVGSSVICFPNPKGRDAADLMLAAVNREITDETLKFVRRDMPIDGSLARAGGEHLHIPSMTLETTSKQPMDKRVHQQEVLVHSLLKHVGMMNSAIPERAAISDGPLAKSTDSAEAHTAAPGAKLRIALYKGPGTGGAGPSNLLKKLDHAPETSITEVTPEDIRAGVLTNYNVVIFGGGSGSKEAEAIGEVGRSNVVEFVGNGGGYVGICAGAYLATSGYPWSLKLVNVKTISPKWQRGRGTLKMELTPEGNKVLGEKETHVEVLYHNGPVVEPASVASLPPYDTLAYFRTEVASNGTPAGVMINSPALIAAPYKKGRVVFCSPHPEQTKGLEELIPHAILWSGAQGEADKPAAQTKEATAGQ